MALISPLLDAAPWVPMPEFERAWRERDMKVSDLVRNCAVFIGIEANGRFIPLGTAFIGGVRYRDLTFQMLVLVVYCPRGS